MLASQKSLALPLELLLQIFGPLDLRPDLVRASHVCHAWRIAVFSHLKYWKNIDINFAAVGAKDPREVKRQTRFAAQRLSRGPPGCLRSISIEVPQSTYILTTAVDSDIIAKFCRMYLGRHINTLDRLVVRYSDIVLLAVLNEIMKRGANVLDYLEISTGFQFLTTPESGPMKSIRGSLDRLLHRPEHGRVRTKWSTIQSDVLEQEVLSSSLHIQMPMLRVLRLYYVHLPDLTTQVFTNVEILSMFQCQGLVFTSLPRRFPRLKTLSVECPPTEQYSLEPTIINHAWLMQLTTLRCDQLELLHHIANDHHIHISTITILGCLEETYNIFLEVYRPWSSVHADGLALHLLPFAEDLFRQTGTIRQTGTSLLELREVSTGHAIFMRVTLRFQEIYEPLGHSQISLSRLATIGVLERLVALDILLSHLSCLLSLALALPNVISLVLTNGLGHDLRQYSTAKQHNPLPRLSAIRLASYQKMEEYLYCSARDVATAIRWNLGPTQAGVSIHLDGVRLVHEDGVLYDNIETSNPSSTSIAILCDLRSERHGNRVRFRSGTCVVNPNRSQS